MGAALVISMVSAGMLMGAKSSLSSLMASLPDNLSQYVSIQLGNVPFLSVTMLLLTAGVSGEWTQSASLGSFSTSSLGVTSSTYIPFTLTGIALAVGAAFGAFMLGRKLSIRFRYVGVLASVAVGLLTGICYMILGATFSFKISMMSISMATGRTFLMSFLTATCGALMGYALAQYCPDASNVFTAFWSWSHRLRGWTRTVVDSLGIYTIVFGTLGLIGMIVYAFAVKKPSVILLIPEFFPLVPLLLFVEASWGAIQLTISSSTSPTTVSIFSVNDAAARWTLWACFVVFLMSTLLIALRAAARNIYDTHHAQWRNTWKAPLAVGLGWFAATFLLTRLSTGIHTSGTASQLSSLADSLTGSDTQSALNSTVAVGPTMWYFLVIGIWIFLAEALAMTFGRNLVITWTRLWGLIRGGAVSPTPTEVSAYVRTSGAVFTRKRQTTIPATATSPSRSSMTTVYVPDYTSPFQLAPHDAPVGTAVAPLSKTQRRGVMVALIAVIVLVVLTITIGIIDAVFFNPTTTATEYMSALERGDYNQVGLLSDPNLTTAKRKLLTNKAALKGSTIANVGITSSEPSKDGSRLISVTYTVDGVKATDSLTLSPDGRAMGIFHKWKVSSPLIKKLTVQTAESVDEIAINGVTITKENADYFNGSFTVDAYPGNYSVGIDNPYLSSSKLTLNTAAKDKSSGELSVSAKPVLSKAIDDQIKKKLDACAQSTEANPSGCPFGYDDSYSFFSEQKQNYKWTITSYPETTSVDPDGSSFDTTSGEAVLSYQGRYSDDDEWENEEYTDSIYVYGTYEITGDTVKVTFENSGY